MAQRAIIKLAFGHQADSFLSASHKSVSQEVALEAEKFGEEETFIFVASLPWEARWPPSGVHLVMSV